MPEHKYSVSVLPFFLPVIANKKKNTRKQKGNRYDKDVNQAHPCGMDSFEIEHVNKRTESYADCG